MIQKYFFINAHACTLKYRKRAPKFILVIGPGDTEGEWDWGGGTVVK